MKYDNWKRKKKKEKSGPNITIHLLCASWIIVIF